MTIHKPRVAYVRTQFVFNLRAGGSVGHTLGVLHGFRENDWEPLVLSNERFFGSEAFNCTVVTPILRTVPGQLLYNIHAKRSLKARIRKWKPAFIYHRFTGYTFVVCSIARELRIPLVLEFNSFETWKMKYWRTERGGLIRRLLRRLLYPRLRRMVGWIEEYNLRNASLIVVVSRALETTLLELGIPQHRILVNPNGVDTDRFDPAVENTHTCKGLRQRLGVQGKIVVGFSGTFGPWHGIPQLTQAIGRILKERMLPDIHFLLLGDGELRPAMEAELGHYGCVTFAGTVPYSEIQYYLALCDVLVSPHSPQLDGKEFFGSPTKLFEYMAMSKGIVASRLGQIGQVLEQGRNAILVEPGNVDQLVDGICLLARDKGLREELGRNAREEALASHTWKNNVERVIAAAAGLVDERHR